MQQQLKKGDRNIEETAETVVKNLREEMT